MEVYVRERALHHNLGGEAKIHRFEGAVGEFGSKIGAQLLLTPIEGLQHQAFPKTTCVWLHQANCAPQLLNKPKHNPGDYEGRREDIVPHLNISFWKVGTGRAVQKALFVIFMGKIDGEGHS